MVIRYMKEIYDTPDVEVVADYVVTVKVFMDDRGVLVDAAVVI